VSAFFKETRKILKIRKVLISTFHPQSNAMIERLHRSLHTGLSRYRDAANTNWDTLLPSYLMAYRATPNSTTGFSPLFLLHGREMVLPSSDDLRAKLSKEVKDQGQARRLETLKTNLAKSLQVGKEQQEIAPK
jgi:transposase InsO family protein